MNAKLAFCLVFVTLLTLVNSYVVDPNVRYSKKVTTSTVAKKASKGLSKVAKWIIIGVIALITISIIICICCCLGCCAACGGSSKKEKNQTIENEDVVGNNPYIKNEPVVEVGAPTMPPQTYNPIYPPTNGYNQPTTTTYGTPMYPSF